MLITMIANMMIKPGNSPVFNTPEDWSLDYEEVTFEAQDGVLLSGWLIKGGTDKVIIQSHFGVQCSRAGYTPKEQGMIKMWHEDISFLNQAKYLVEAGYSVLMYDFRNHGNSAQGTCPWITWGPEEHKDVIAAVDYITQRPDYKDCSIGLLSICMGQSATTLAYGLPNGLQNYAAIKAMVVVQPLSYAKFVKAFGIPNFLAKRANKVIEKRTNIDFSTNTFMPNVKNISVPTMVIQNKNDPWTDLEEVKEYYLQLKVEKEMFWINAPNKRAAAYDWIGKNPESILSWFDKYI